MCLFIHHTTFWKPGSALLVGLGNRAGSKTGETVRALPLRRVPGASLPFPEGQHGTGGAPSEVLRISEGLLHN